MEVISNVLANFNPEKKVDEDELIFERQMQIFEK